jgi:hypothetical protein
LARERGYAVQKDTSLNLDFPSTELHLDTATDIANQKSYQFYHNIFSASELQRFLEDAVAAHNPNYTVTSVPKSEQHLVLQKAMAVAYRVLAADAVRRKSIETEPGQLITLAQDLEAQYEKDRARHQRVIPVPKADESNIGTGDVIVGRLTRFSLRRGYNAEARAANPPPVPVLLQPAEGDVQDVLVRLRWQPVRDTYFAKVELWRDTKPNIERSIANDQGQGLPSVTSSYVLPSSSKRITQFGRTAGDSPTFDGVTFGIYAEYGLGARVTNTEYIDGLNDQDPLRTETTYYYQLFVMNVNGEVTPSNVIAVKTKKRRALFKRAGKALASDAIEPLTGPLAGGTSITIKGKNFEQSTRVTIGGANCTITSQTSTELVVTAPEMTNEAFVGVPLDIILISPTGLEDIAQKMWRYT